MRVELFTVIKNEEKILPLFLEHYQRNFPGIIIVIYDNKSTDKSVEICKNYNCIVRVFDEYSEKALQTFKNTIWKVTTADWVIICDADELIQIKLDDLSDEFDVYQFMGYGMTSLTEECTFLEELIYGYKDERYSKACLFRPHIGLKYSIGAHLFKTKGRVSIKEFKLFHYNKHLFTKESLFKNLNKTGQITKERSDNIYEKHFGKIEKLI